MWREASCDFIATTVSNSTQGYFSLTASNVFLSSCNRACRSSAYRAAFMLNPMRSKGAKYHQIVAFDLPRTGCKACNNINTNPPLNQTWFLPPQPYRTKTNSVSELQSESLQCSMPTPSSHEIEQKQQEPAHSIKLNCHYSLHSIPCSQTNALTLPPKPSQSYSMVPFLAYPNFKRYTKQCVQQESRAPCSVAFDPSITSGSIAIETTGGTLAQPRIGKWVLDQKHENVFNYHNKHNACLQQTEF